jgi:hypothetical protein
VGYVTGGSFKGARFNGDILPGGGNWSHGGELTPGVAVGAFDARTLWRTGDGATIYVSYTGRSVISDTVIARLRGSDANTVPPSDYYIRIAPVFETEDRRYAWLNGILAVGCGQKTPFGIRHWIFSIL